MAGAAGRGGHRAYYPRHVPVRIGICSFADEGLLKRWYPRGVSTPAARLAYYLNQLHPEQNGRYAEIITSDIPDADAAIRRFKKEKYPMVAVSVDMLTTGFDCREILHLVLCRKIFSPILYQQIRGRGTRTAPHIGKKRFVIYDFFRNHEYFNDSETEIFEGPAGMGGGGGRRPQQPGTRSERAATLRTSGSFVRPRRLRRREQVVRALA